MTAACASAPGGCRTMLTSGWPVARGGTGAIIEALLNVLQEHGGRVHLGSPVTDLRELPPADAVVYLMRHLHAGDVRFLESFHDRDVARATPVNTICSTPAALNASASLAVPVTLLIQ